MFRAFIIDGMRSHDCSAWIAFPVSQHADLFGYVLTNKDDVASCVGNLESRRNGFAVAS